MRPMHFTDIRYRKADATAFISLDRPETRNAFTLPMIESLCTALKDAQTDRNIKAVVLSGEGGAFCSGGNVKDMAEGKLTSWNMKHYLWEHVQRIPLLLQDLDKPVIAAVDGAAHGGGFDLAMACDLRIATERATFCATYVKIGLAPGNGSAYFLTKCLGIGKAFELLITGRVVETKEALELGLVQEVVPPERLSAEVGRYTGQITKWPLESLRAVKRSVYNGLHCDLKSHLDYMSSQLALLSQTLDHRRAIENLVRKK